MRKLLQWTFLCVFRALKGVCCMLLCILKAVEVVLKVLEGVRCVLEAVEVMLRMLGVLVS